MSSTDPILREFPFSFETERLLIRGPLPGDGALTRQAVLESQNELKPWMPWAVTVPSEEAYEVMARQWHVKWLTREDLGMFLLLKGTATLVGRSGLHRIDWTVPKFEIGYWVHSDHARRGYITEAVAGITRFAFEELGAGRVEIRCDAKNVRSAAIPRRLGFEHEGTLRHEARHHITNELRDTMVFSRTRPFRT